MKSPGVFYRTPAVISESALRKAAMSSAVLNGPGLSRIVPSGKVPSRLVAVRGAVQAGADGDPEAAVERSRRGLAGGSTIGVGDDQRERADVRRRVPPAGDFPARRTTLQPRRRRRRRSSTSWSRFASAPRCSTTQAIPAARPAMPRTLASPLEIGDLFGLDLGLGSPPMPPSARAASGRGLGGRRRGAGAGRAVERLVAGEGEQVDGRRA